LLTADGASELTEMILRVLSDRGERRRLAEAGRTRVLARHSWKDSMRQFDRLIDECLHAAGSPACASAS
jgi:glycosyltransferase involved in cell wall biosynthesis